MALAGFARTSGAAMKRFRLRTLMVLVVIAALVAAVLVQQIQINRYKVQLQASVAENSVMQAEVRRLRDRLDVLTIRQAEMRATAEHQLEEAKKQIELSKSNAAKDER
jgi:regulator of replication initiation timing